MSGLAPNLTPIFNRGPIVSRRLVVRTLKSSDAESLFDALTDQNGAMRDFIGIPERACLYCDQVKMLILPLMAVFKRTHNHHYVAAFKQGDPHTIIGLSACSVDIKGRMRAAYFIREHHRGHGYGTEMYSAVTKAMSRMTGQSIIVSEVMPSNHESIGLLQRLGFHRRGIHRGTIEGTSNRSAIAFEKHF